MQGTVHQMGTAHVLRYMDCTQVWVAVEAGDNNNNNNGFIGNVSSKSLFSFNFFNLKSNVGF